MSLLEDIEEETSDWEEVEMEKVPEKKDVQDKDLKKKTAEDKNLEDEGAAGGSIPEFGSQINTTDVFLLYFVSKSYLMS